MAAGEGFETETLVVIVDDNHLKRNTTRKKEKHPTSTSRRMHSPVFDIADHSKVLHNIIVLTQKKYSTFGPVCKPNG